MVVIGFVGIWVLVGGDWYLYKVLWFSNIIFTSSYYTCRLADGIRYLCSCNTLRVNERGGVLDSGAIGCL